MGGFLSKLSEEHEAAKVQPEEGKRDVGPSEKRIDFVTVKTNSSGGDIPLVPILIGTVAYVMLSVALKYASYVDGKISLKRSEVAIEELEAMIRSDGANSQDPCLAVKLKHWKQRRDIAETYLKKHKIIGKLVKTFPPDICLI